MSCIEFFNSFLTSTLQTIIIDGSGILLNGLCVICFAQILWHRHESTVNNKANMFKFLFVKAICDLLIFTNDMISLTDLYCQFVFTSCHLHATSDYWYWAIICQNYVQLALTIVSSLMEVAATLGKRK
jgi:hypothetical protein